MRKLKKFIEWHRSSIRWFKNLTGWNNYTLLWFAFLEGVILTLLVGYFF